MDECGWTLSPRTKSGPGVWARENAISAATKGFPSETVASSTECLPDPALVMEVCDRNPGNTAHLQIIH